MKKKFLALALTAVMALSLAACGGDTQSTDTDADTSGDESASGSQTYTVGIIQQVQHEALDAATQFLIAICRLLSIVFPDVLQSVVPGSVEADVPVDAAPEGDVHRHGDLRLQRMVFLGGPLHALRGQGDEVSVHFDPLVQSGQEFLQHGLHLVVRIVSQHHLKRHVPVEELSALVLLPLGLDRWFWSRFARSSPYRAGPLPHGFPGTGRGTSWSCMALF